MEAQSPLDHHHRSEYPTGCVSTTDVHSGSEPQPWLADVRESPATEHDGSDSGERAGDEVMAHEEIPPNRVDTHRCRH